MAKRKIFFSFKYDDVFKVEQIRNSRKLKSDYNNIGFFDKAQREKIKKNSEQEIKKWIDKQLFGTTITIVLIGPRTSISKFVRYEIEESIKRGNGLLGIYIHKMKSIDNISNSSEKYAFLRPVKGAVKGENPLCAHKIIQVENNPNPLFSNQKSFFNFRFKDIRACEKYKSYDWISNSGYQNIEEWIEEAIAIAKRK